MRHCGGRGKSLEHRSCPNDTPCELFRGSLVVVYGEDESFTIASMNKDFAIKWTFFRLGKPFPRGYEPRKTSSYLIAAPATIYASGVL